MSAYVLSLTVGYGFVPATMDIARSTWASDREPCLQLRGFVRIGLIMDHARITKLGEPVDHFRRTRDWFTSL